MDLRDFDFSKCRYNPLSKTFIKSIESRIPSFAEYEEKDKKRVFQYVVVLYDKHSPLWSKEPEYFPRKILAINLCGLAVRDGGGFTRAAMDILEGANEAVNNLVTAYLADTGDIEYTMLITELTMYHALFHQQASGRLLDERQYKVMKELMDNIQSRTRKIFGTGLEEELTRVKNLLYERAEQDRQRLHPEAIVKMLEKDGDFPNEWCRYGAKYKVDELTYYTGDDSQGEATKV